MKQLNYLAEIEVQSKLFDEKLNNLKQIKDETYKEKEILNEKLVR